MIKLNRDRIVGFLVGYIFAVAATWLGSVIPFLNHWTGALLLLILVFVIIPLSRRYMANRSAKKEQVADVQEKQEA